MRRFIGIAIAVCCAAGAARAQTDIYLRTERAGRGKVPIIVKDISAVSGRERDSASLLTKVIRADLDLSGLIEVIQPAEDGGADEGRAVGAIFEGTLVAEGSSLALEARLLDYQSRETIFSKRYRFGADARRHVAHTVSDEIVYFLVGERGIATTRLLFRRAHGKGKDLYVVDYDGFGETVLIGQRSLSLSPCWGTGRAWVAFTSASYSSRNGKIPSSAAPTRCRSASSFSEAKKRSATMPMKNGDTIAAMAVAP